MKAFLNRLALAIVANLAGTAAASGQTAVNVAVIINESSATSERIGEYYVRQRGIPPANVIRIRTTDQETIDRTIFTRTIEQPIAAALSRERLQDRVLYLVLTKGVPLRVSGTGGHEGTGVSVDSELTLLYRRMTGVPSPTRGRVDNPYFLGSREISDARPFTHREHDIFLVTRLDAFTPDEAMALVDKAKASATEGRVVLDQRDALVNRIGEEWLQLAAKRLVDQGHEDRVVLEKTVMPARDISPVLGYYSWGSSDPQNRVRNVKMGFVPGALAGMLVSFDARTFTEPPPGWTPPTILTDRSKWFVDAPTSLAADLIREGVTGVAGSVAEPYLESIVRPQILFPAYLAGFNLVESFYLATPHLSWQTVIVGDPLCAPFRNKLSTTTDIRDDIDPDTELPALFSKRRLAQWKASAPGTPDRALVLALRAEGLTVKGDLDGARAAMEEATQIAPHLISQHLRLAARHEQDGEYDLAIDRYRKVLAVEPRNVVALNNLAYALAVHQDRPDEALPLARQAVDLSKENPVMLDTLAWVEHLLGNKTNAPRLIAQAVKGSPRNAEIRLHAAIIYETSGAIAAAEIELKEAIRLDPRLEKRADVVALRSRLDALKQPSVSPR